MPSVAQTPDKERRSMKIKPAVTEGTPEAVLVAINSPELAKRIYEEVLRKHLRVSQMGPAEWYVQKNDFTVAVDGEIGCEVRLTGLSRNPRRSEQDFWDARDALEAIYQQAIAATLLAGMRMQLFVALMLDAPIRDQKGRDTTIVEADAIWVDGRA